MKIELSSIIENQLPQYVREEFPLAVEFLKQYYISNTSDEIVQNLEQYLDLDSFFDIDDQTILTANVSLVDDTIIVESTKGFSDSYGLLKIDDEIITYKSKTDTTFEGCQRGFSGIDKISQNQLNFAQTEANVHNQGAFVENLSILFLKEFFLKTKQKIAPGFENRDFFTDVNKSNFLKRIKDFYQSKGTAESFRILFAALFGKSVEMVLPRDQLFSASNAQYRVSKKLIVESLEGNPSELINGTIYQDDDGFIAEARGTITYVEKIIRNGREYFAISLDFDYDKDIDVAGTIKSDFTIHPQTITTNIIESNSEFIDVDSTVGFPESGSLIIDSLIINYTSKTFNQFLGCTGIDLPLNNGTSIRYNSYAYGYNQNNEIVKLRITGVLDDVSFANKNYAFRPFEKFEIETLGFPSNDLKANSWKFNIPLSYNIDTIELVDLGSLSYKVSTIDEHIFNVGDSISLVSPSNLLLNGRVTTILNDHSIVVSLQQSANLAENYYIRKNISKVNFTDLPELSKYSSNVQNTFVDYEKNVYVLSPSLPSYSDEISVNDGKIVLSGNFENIITFNSHPFHTGDSVVFTKNSTSSLLESGIYFIKRESSDTFKLALSRDNIFTNDFIDFNGLISGTLQFSSFTDNNLNSKEIQPQNLIRKISSPKITTVKYETPLSTVGIFNNGVEILNYKSNDQLFYGSIEAAIVTSPGQNYDIINPPELTVIDSFGTSGVLSPVIRGNLKKINVVDSGFDYIVEPEIIISGGNGKNASAKANLIEIEHIEFFNAESDVNLGSETIGFSTYHKFRNTEEVIYKSSNQTSIGGLENNEKYFVSVKSPTLITLHKSSEDAVTGINSINLTSYGSGIQSIQAVNKKNIITSVSVLSSGENYEYKKNKIIGINTNSNVISIKNHKFNSGEIVVYESTGAVSTGLVQNKKYYLTSINKDTLKLSEINTSGESDFYYKNQQYVNITQTQTVDQFISYPSIQVEIKGRIGISTFGSENYNATLQPIFRGEFVDTTVHSGGQNYGSSDILNYNRSPQINVSKGTGAQLKAIVNFGKIVGVIIQSPGNNYVSIPDILVTGEGYNASLTPIIENGQIIDVKIISGGFNYNSNTTTINVISAGSGVKFQPILKSWRVNSVKRFEDSGYFSANDGFVSNGKFGLQFYNLFADRLLRETTYSKKIINDSIIYTPDLQKNSDGNEIDSVDHSPILGWAYDGNPIYGPFGYSTRFNATSVKQLTSGYTLKTLSELTAEGRPTNPVSYPLGFFVEDYKFVGNSDLDEHNGRYCVTPEFPNGTYAYFATVENTSSANGYKSPKFPYIIGNTFYSKPSEFNLNINSNQTNLDLNSLNLLRNTKPYNLNSDYTNYDGLFLPYQVKNGPFNVKSVKSSKIDSIDVISSGQNYKINDKIVIENNNLGKVTKIEGKTVASLASSLSIQENIEFLARNNEILGITSIPHSFENGNHVFFGAYEGKNQFSEIKLPQNTFILSVGVASTTITGLVTFINVYGDIQNSLLLSNDVYKINNEQVKVLNVDKNGSRLRVLRAINGTSGINSHQVSTGVTELSRKFILPNKIGVTTGVINREIYFKPKESVAIGLSYGIGINSTLYFSNPGIGETFVTVPTRSIYLPEHNLNTNDRLIYNSYNNNSISISTNGITTSSLNSGSELFVAKINEQLIGVSTRPIGIGSTGIFSGIGSSSNLLYFYNSGTGEYQSFTTNYLSANADVIKQDIVVSTATTHNLSLNDSFSLNVATGFTTICNIKYNDSLRVLVANETQISNAVVNSNILVFSGHNFRHTEKVVYVSDTQAIGGLQNNGIYYVIYVSPFKIKLANTYYDATRLNSIDFTSTGNGWISSINPSVVATKNSSIDFNLSDSSLSYVKNGSTFPAFKFKVFYDSNFTNEYFNDNQTPNSNVIESGIVGSPSAKVTLVYTENTPNNLYYRLVPIESVEVPIVKTSIIEDRDQLDPNSIVFKDNILTKNYPVEQFTGTTFRTNLDFLYLPFNANTSNSDVSYATNSTTADGGIKEVAISKNNPNNNTIPNVVSIISENGSGANLRVVSKNIGEINSVNLDDIGYEYSVDTSIKPKLNLPKIVKTEPLYTIESISIDSLPVNYYTKPQLIFIDNYDNTVVPDVALDFILDQKQVKIIKNSQKIRGTNPFIIPVNNTVGVAISNISYNESTKNVTVILDAGFSNLNDFPFEDGDKIIVENVIVSSGEKGYNSAAYDYALFEIENVDPKIGGVGASFTYNMSDYLLPGELPGTYNGNNLKGIVTPAKYFPIFDIKIKAPTFIEGENISTPNTSGILVDQNIENNFIKVLTNDDLSSNDVLTGQSSKTSVIISEVVEFEAYFNAKSSTRVVDGWKRETGFFNNNLQRLHDNNYYQYFSYALKSDVNYKEWNEVVSDLVHPAGFKKFSDLIVYSEVPVDVGFSTSVITEHTPVNESISDIDMNCIDNYDLVRENYFFVDNELKSNQINFGSAILQDYIDSIGNRVLPIDDVVIEFSETSQPQEYVPIDTYSIDDFYYKKYFISVLDKWNPEKSEIILVTTLQNNNQATLNQYAEVSNSYSLGSFDIDIENQNANLLFYPENYFYSSYYVNSFAYSIGKSHTGVSTVNLGNIAKQEYSGKSHFIGIGTTTVVGFSSSVRAAKILIGLAYTDNSHFELDEINLIHDGTNIHYNNYGELKLSNSSVGVGTFNVYYSGNRINVDLIPTNLGFGTEFRINSNISLIQNTAFSGVGTTSIGKNSLFSSEVTTTGIATQVFSYSNENSGSYSIVCIQNSTNSTYSVLEFVTSYNPITNEVSYVEYGNVNTNNNLGIISSYLKNSNIIIEFKPTASANYNIRSINNTVGSFQDKVQVGVNSSFKYDCNFVFYEAALLGNKKEFELTHLQQPIFTKSFDGSSVAGVNTLTNSIIVPNHYFVTGEEVSYSYSGAPIGIALTTIGAGTTDLLPSNLFIVKVDDLNVQVASAASFALASTPSVLDLKTLGVGTNHTLTSKYTNNRALVSVDNIIQKPVIGIAKTTVVTNNVGYYNNLFTLQNPSEIISGDLLKIDDEIVRVLAVGVGSTNVVQVDRAKLGTDLIKHQSNSLISKVKGNYNIIGNTIHYDVPSYTSEENYNFNYTFSGRVFLRSGEINTSNRTYYDNYIFDDVSTQFNGITKTFALKTNQANITGVEDSNAIVLINNVFQATKFDYNINQVSGASSITFTGSATSFSYDVNTASIPRGGIIVSAGSTSGFGYQPVVSAGGTAIVSLAGTIQSISIGNSGSGYRSGIQTVRVGVKTESTGVPNIQFIGTATVSNGNVIGVSITNPGIGYTAFPVKYIREITSNVAIGATIIPLNYIPGITTSDKLSVGIAITNATITGIGTTVITIGAGFTSKTAISSGTTAIIKNYNPPEVVFDAPLPFANLPLIYAPGNSGLGTEARVNIVVGQGSSVISFEIVNSGYGYKVGDVLTVSYGGSVGIPTDTTKSLSQFKLTVDQVFYDDFASWSVGDLQSFDPLDSFFDGVKRSFQLRISNTPTSLRTKPGSNINLKYNLLVFINDVLQIPDVSYTFNGGSVITFNEAPQKTDTSKIVFYRGTSEIDTLDVDIIEDVKIGDTLIINSEDENYQQTERLVSDIITSDSLNTTLYNGVGISSDESLTRPVKLCRQTSDIILNGQIVGKNRVIYEPIIIPTTQLISNISVGSTQLFVDSLRTYFDNKKEYLLADQENKSVRVISQDENNLAYETITGVSYDGDFGVISGIKTTTIGVGSTGIVFQFYIAPDSILRTNTYISGDTSELKQGYYFKINNSNIGNGLISLENNGTQIGVGTTFINNIYKAYSVSIASTSVIGVGMTNVLEVTAKVDRFITGVGISNYYGDFSWGRIHSFNRTKPKAFTINPIGISTAPIIQRIKPLKFENYYT